MSDLDLVSWTLQEARQLSPERPMRGESEVSPLLGNLLEVLEGDRGKSGSEGIRAVSIRSVQVAVNNPIAPPPSDIPEAPKAGTIAADLQTYTHAAVPAAIQAARMSPALPMSPLLKALVEPDIDTAPADRERAIMLRWVLRDIKANRLRLSPVNQPDLRDLTDMGLVEIRNDIPVLTNAGADAIA
ncbi:hypothetical protein [Bradyrhizobium erythrophlei]|uniref:Uncharacterized protein n=1 Tax=Bradyrhizobium erythrophlei TaxID=1437360 RepID=A0A1M5R7J8_9BRAD|nr:hypothetical protein [Bradyrhizobium erythrophlei]SHH22148.1 hypothetical protein SAMN05444169_6388 [Bradyrhizobium erythrophlei]